MIYPKTFIAIFTLILLVHMHIFAYMQIEKPLATKEKKEHITQIKIKRVEIENAVKKIKKKIVKKKLIKPVKKIVEKPIQKKIEKRHVTKNIPKKETIKPIKKEKVIKTKEPIIDMKELNNLENKYLTEIKKAIESKKFYPRKSKKLKQMDTVIIGFSILENGSIKDIKIVKASRFKRLNKATLKILKRIKNFQQIPKKLNKKSWKIEIPVEYKIIN